jgi:hypothetical protein
MKAGELIVQILVVGGFALWAYSAFKKQSIKDTVDQIKEMFKSNE